MGVEGVSCSSHHAKCTRAIDLKTFEVPRDKNERSLVQNCGENDLEGRPHPPYRCEDARGSGSQARQEKESLQPDLRDQFLFVLVGGGGLARLLAPSVVAEFCANAQNGNLSGIRHGFFIAPCKGLLVGGLCLPPTFR